MPRGSVIGSNFSTICMLYILSPFYKINIFVCQFIHVYVPEVLKKVPPTKILPSIYSKNTVDFLFCSKIFSSLVVEVLVIIQVLENLVAHPVTQIYCII